MTGDTCGCCAPPSGGTPLTVYNRPGLSALAYRIGTFTEFRQAMLSRIAASPELFRLSTRSSDDYGIAVMELFAALSDILTFYQERIADEAYLRTATQRDSVLRLARMIGYELSPGAAATVYLAFTTDKDKSVDIPVGLKVQSVPAQDEQPAKFETLEAVTAVPWLNGLQVLPKPICKNPLSKGRTSAYLVPGTRGLDLAATLKPKDNILVFNEKDTNPVEGLIVKDIETDLEHKRLVWTCPVQSTDFDVTTSAYKQGQTFKLFGYNAVTPYPKATGTTAVEWSMSTITAGGTPGTDSFAVAAGRTLDLAGRYDVKVGTRLLMVDGSGNKTLLTVTGSSESFQTLGALTDTVTSLTVKESFAQINDRRPAVLHELTGPCIAFWGYDYPDVSSASTVLLLGRKIDGSTIEVGRSIKSNGFETGMTVDIRDIEKKRRVLLLNGETPINGTILGAALCRTEIAMDASALDSSTVVKYALDGESARSVELLCGGVVDSFSLTASLPAMKVTLSDDGIARTIQLGSRPSGAADAASKIEAALQGAASDTAFGSARVVALGKRLLVIPGRADVSFTFEGTPDDETTVFELRLDADTAEIEDALLSGDIDPVPALSYTAPEVQVRIGPFGPVTLELTPGITALDDLADMMQTALHTAHPAPCFQFAKVRVVDKRLLILPGVSGYPQQAYLQVDIQTASEERFQKGSTQLKGNIALASHGETISNEILGSGDPAVPFSAYTLKKSPVTFVPSSTGSNGVVSTLQVTINNAVWQEVDTLYGAGKDDEIYTARIDNDGAMTVRFGDSVTGARPLAGKNNIVASYRKGTGSAGRAAAGAVKILLDKPKGLKSVTNASAAEGGADPEELNEAQQNAPNTVRTFDRAVSLLDFEDLVRESGEVQKACAAWVWNNDRRAVHLTVGGQEGGLFSSAALLRIHASLTSRRDPNRILMLDNYTPRPVEVTCVLKIKDNYVSSAAAEEALSVLLTWISFDGIPFGEPVHLSDIMALLQGVQGVQAVDIDRLMFKRTSNMDAASFEAFLNERRIERAGDGTPLPVQQRLPIFGARPLQKGLGASPAEQAVIESAIKDVIILTQGGKPD